MKSRLIILFICVSFSVFANDRNGYCNFLLELGEGVEMDSTYTLTGVGFENLKLRHKEKLMTRINYQALLHTKIDMLSLQKGLSSICRYKKWEIIKVKIVKQELGVLLQLSYQEVPKEAKSKA